MWTVSLCFSRRQFRPSYSLKTSCVCGISRCFIWLGSFITYRINKRALCPPVDGFNSNLKLQLKVQYKLNWELSLKVGCSIYISWLAEKQLKIDLSAWDLVTDGPRCGGLILGSMSVFLMCFVCTLPFFFYPAKKRSSLMKLNTNLAFIGTFIGFSGHFSAGFFLEELLLVINKF